MRAVTLVIVATLARADGLLNAPSTRPSAVASTSRRTLVSSALLTALALPAGAATFAERADASLERIRTAETREQLVDGLGQVGQLAEEYGGLGDRKEDVVQKLRTLKSSALWDDDVQTVYRDAMRNIDPFRVVAVRPAMQTTAYLFAPAYVALIGVQQVLPKFFGPAYAFAALVLFGPIALAISNS
jgi:hypothetical protein